MVKGSVRYWTIAAIAALVIAVLFVKPFLPTIALAALMAYTFNPFYKKFLVWFKGRKTVAAWITLISSLLIVAIPILVILSLTVIQARTFITSITQALSQGESVTLSSLINGLVDTVNNVAAPLSGQDSLLQADTIFEFIRSKVPEITSTAIHIITSTLGSVPRFFMFFVTYIFLFLGMLRYQDKLISAFKTLLPFHESVGENYLNKAGAMTRSMVRGQFLIAFLEGIIGAASLQIVGIHYFFFFLVLLTFLSFIPVGGGIITIPVGIVFILTGNIWQGLFLIGVHLLITTNVDLLRTKLVPKDAYLNPALMILAVFAGVHYYGLLGVVYGPIIMILIVTTITTYLELKNSRAAKAVETSPSTAKQT